MVARGVVALSGGLLLIGRKSSIHEPLPAFQMVSPKWSGQ